MMQPTIEQLYAEVFQCQVLLQAATERLARLSSMMQQMEGGAALPTAAYLPPDSSGANKQSADLPHNMSGANDYPGTLPQHTTGTNNSGALSRRTDSPAKQQGVDLPPYAFPANAPAGYFPQHASGAIRPPILPTVKQLSRVLKQKAFGKTTGLHIRRTAELMLFISQHPGEAFGVAPYAKLLGMGYAGAAKLMMLTRRKGLIKRTAYKVHAVTAQGLAYMQEALLPVAE